MYGNSFILFEKCWRAINFIFDCDYVVKFLDLNNIPAFYTDVLNAWAEVREQISDNEIRIRNVILWNNKHILRR